MGAFDRIDPTKVITKCILLGVRSSITKVLIDFLNERKMQVKMNNQKSQILDLVGGGPQGSIIGQLLYIIASNDVIEDVSNEDKFKYIDDISVLDAVNHRHQLVNYNALQHVPSDIAVDEKYLPPESLKTPAINKEISDWTTSNKMRLNEQKSNFLWLLPHHKKSSQQG